MSKAGGDLKVLLIGVIFCDPNVEEPTVIIMLRGQREKISLGFGMSLNIRLVQAGL